MVQFLLGKHLLWSSHKLDLEHTLLLLLLLIHHRIAEVMTHQEAFLVNKLRYAVGLGFLQEMRGAFIWARVTTWGFLLFFRQNLRLTHGSFPRVELTSWCYALDFFYVRKRIISIEIFDFLLPLALCLVCNGCISSLELSVRFGRNRASLTSLVARIAILRVCMSRDLLLLRLSLDWSNSSVRAVDGHFLFFFDGLALVWTQVKLLLARLVHNRLYLRHLEAFL